MVDIFTNRKAVAQVRELMGDATGKLSDDSAWSRHFILDKLYKTRATVLNQKIEQGQMISQHNLQTIPSIPLVMEDEVKDVPCAPPKGCIWAKTQFDIPPYIKLISVTSIDGGIKYDPLTWTEVRHRLRSFYPNEAKRPYYTMKTVGTHVSLYLLHDKHKKFVTVTGIAADPREWQLFPDCNGKTHPCPKILDLPFVIDPDVEGLIYDAVINALKVGRSGSTVDIYNNETEDFTQPPIK